MSTAFSTFDASDFPAAQCNAFQALSSRHSVRAFCRYKAAEPTRRRSRACACLRYILLGLNFRRLKKLRRMTTLNDMRSFLRLIEH